MSNKIFTVELVWERLFNEKLTKHFVNHKTKWKVNRSTYMPWLLEHYLMSRCNKTFNNLMRTFFTKLKYFFHRLRWEVYKCIIILSLHAPTISPSLGTSEEIFPHVWGYGERSLVTCPTTVTSTEIALD